MMFFSFVQVAADITPLRFILGVTADGAYQSVSPLLKAVNLLLRDFAFALFEYSLIG
jgi:hypothetical protein